MRNLLITSRRISLHDEVYFSVDSNWFKYFENYKLFSLPNNLDNVKNIYRDLDFSCVVLSGGGSIKSNKLDINPCDDDREKVEEFLIEKSISDNIPLISVCRGTQKVVSYLEKNIEFIDNPIQIKEGFSLYNSNNIKVENEKHRTCYNQYSFKNKNLSKNWKIIFVDKFDNIQLLEHKKFKILSFMWHPERDMTDKNLINNFLK